jgi:hypothetical protein
MGSGTQRGQRIYACDRNTAYGMSDIIETLAEFIHEQWRRGDWKKEPHLDVPYARLAPAAQDDNRAAARRIPEVLALAGFGIARREEAGSSTRPSTDEVARNVEAHIELMAEAEHDGWMAQRAGSGWRYGPVRDNAQKLHPFMIAYGDLPEAEKDKDRVAVRNYPSQVRAAGLQIVRL